MIDNVNGSIAYHRACLQLAIDRGLLLEESPDEIAISDGFRQCLQHALEYDRLVESDKWEGMMVIQYAIVAYLGRAQAEEIKSMSKAVYAYLQTLKPEAEKKEA